MKISVITVCFNSRDFIDQTIESVLSQNYPDFEYIIVDGGSTDGTVDLIRHYAEKDARINWCSEPDQGIADAMNKGASIAVGDVIAHLNSDDYYASDQVLSRVADCFKLAPSTGWLTAGFNFISATGTFIREVRVRRYSFRRLLRGNIILHPSTFVRNELFSTVCGFDPSLQYCMDYDLFLRLGSHSPPFILDEQLTCFRIHSGSRSVNQSEKTYAEEFKVRMTFLRKLGRSTWYYALDYQVKRRWNKMFYRGLLEFDR